MAGDSYLAGPGHERVYELRSKEPAIASGIEVSEEPNDVSHRHSRPTFDVASEDDTDVIDFRYRQTRRDAANMERMGVKQEFVRRFQFISSLALAWVASTSWQINTFLVTPGLTDGGTPLLILTYVWSFFFFIPVYLSMAEMASMSVLPPSKIALLYMMFATYILRAPICGSQFHWVSEFGSAKYQKLLSYVTGWLSTMAWQAGMASGPIIVGTLIQTMIQVGDPNYSYPNWHGCLLSIAMACVNYVVNVYGAKTLPYWQAYVFILVITAFFGFFVPIWVNAPKISASESFGNWKNSGGWSSLALAILVGQVAGVNTGADLAAHLSEDVKNAGKTVPLVMMWTFLGNTILGIAAIVSICTAITDVTAALNDPTAYPAIWVLRQAMSKPYIILELAIVDILILCGNVSYMAAVTRDLFAFARDDGVPFSHWLATIHPKRQIPENAIKLTTLISIAGCLVYLGSPVALYAITSLYTVSILQCYVLSIACILWRRIYHPETLPPSQFSLGRFGIPINSIAVLWCVWEIFWSFWPIYANPSAALFNWACVAYVAVLFLAAVHYVVWARHVYTGPVTRLVSRTFSQHDSGMVQ